MKLKIALVQFSPILGEREKNIQKIYDKIEKTDCDIIVFPELSTSGYFFLNREESIAVGESLDGDFITKLKSLAAKLNKTIVAGFPELEGSDSGNMKVYNSIAAVFPEPDSMRIYRKSHLFYKEKFCFEPGDTGFFVIEDKIRDINIGLMICYDWRFPEASRTLALKGADIILCPSNLVTDVWHKVMPARAIENKVYFAVANRCGREEREGEELFFKGESAIYSYNGSELAKAGISDEETIIAEIEPEKTRDKSFNAFNDVFKDRRPELYL